ncbi:MAG: diguanylate cyclase [Fibrobacterales bacterium]
MSIRLKLSLYITFLFVMTIGNALFFFALDKNSEEKLRWVNHTHEVLIKVESYLGFMKDTETGQRGYLLTKNISYLDPYYRGILEAKKSFKDLSQLVSDNPTQTQRLKAINKDMLLKFDELNRTITLTQMSRSDSALIIVSQHIGKQYMDNIRAVLNEFISKEMLLLEKRKGDFRENKAQITTMILIEIIVFVFLAIMSISFLRKNLFIPLSVLLSNTHKMEKGQQLEINDFVSNDEMGYLMSSFYKMNQKVHTRTQDLDYQAHHDELTGLNNRSKIYEFLKSTIDLTIKLDSKCAVLFMDLNKFKELNDSLGHDVGDTVLKESSDKLRSCIRTNDKLFRIGGDEFVILIKGLTSPQDVEVVIKKINNIFQLPITINGEEMKISISIGVAIAPDHSQDPEKILKMADVAMYQSKKYKERSYTMFEKSMLQRSTDL